MKHVDLWLAAVLTVALLLFGLPGGHLHAQGQVVLSDDFDGPAPGYDTSLWSQVQSGTGSLTWDGDETVRLETTSPSGNGIVQLVSNLSMRSGNAEFRIEGQRDLTGAGGDASLEVGWSSAVANETALILGLHPDHRLLAVTQKVAGTGSRQLYSVTDTRGWHTYRIEWEERPGNVNGNYRLFMDSVEIPTTGSNIPNGVSLPFHARIIGGPARLDLEYVTLTDPTLPTPTPTPVPPTPTPLPGTLPQPTPTPTPVIAPIDAVGPWALGVLAFGFAFLIVWQLRAEQKAAS